MVIDVSTVVAPGGVEAAYWLQRGRTVPSKVLETRSIQSWEAVTDGGYTVKVHWAVRLRLCTVYSYLYIIL